MEKLLLTLGLIVSGLTLGNLLQVADRHGALPLSIAALRRFLQKLGLLFFMPISFLGAVWVVSLANLRVALLPLLGALALSAGGLLGLGLARLLRRSPGQTGVLFCCGSFSNIGAIGGLVCFMFLGEAGFALVALYKMFEEILYYTIGFPLARYFSGGADNRKSVGRRIIGVVTDPFVAAVLSAFFAGLLLNLSGLTRPALFETITALFVPIGTFVLIVSIGLGMRFSKVGQFLHESIGIGLIKFVAVPLITCSIASLLGLEPGSLAFRVTLVLSSMPVAFNALVAASIYDLDLDLANSCWLVTTGSLLVILPWLYFLLHTPLFS